MDRWTRLGHRPHEALRHSAGTAAEFDDLLGRQELRRLGN